MTPPFARTACACAADVENCRRPGYLGAGDPATLAEALGVDSLLDVRHLFRRGRAVLGNADGDRLVVPTVVPARQRGGACVFLMPDDRCCIHPVAPFGCAYFDVHQPRAEADRRSLWMLHRIVRDGQDYFALAAQLEPKEVDD